MTTEQDLELAITQAHHDVESTKIEHADRLADLEKARTDHRTFTAAEAAARQALVDAPEVSDDLADRVVEAERATKRSAIFLQREETREKTAAAKFAAAQERRGTAEKNLLVLRTSTEHLTARLLPHARKLRDAVRMLAEAREAVDLEEGQLNAEFFKLRAVDPTFNRKPNLKQLLGSALYADHDGRSYGSEGVILDWAKDPFATREWAARNAQANSVA